MTMIEWKRLLAAVAVVAIIGGCAPGSGQATGTPPAAAPSAAQTATPATAAGTPAPSATASAAPSTAQSAAPSATSAPPSAAASAATAPSFDTTTPVTLVEWDTETSPGPSAAMDALNAAFSAKYPNVTIKRTAKNFDDYVTTIKLAASGSDAPDVFHGNEGYQVDAALVKAGLILPLDDYAKAYGWDTRFGSSATLDVLRWSNDGTTWTKGPLWGIPQKAEVLGVFYNKATLEKLGLAVPTTFDEFESSLATAKAQGVPGIVVGGLDGWPLGHVFMILQPLFEDPQQIANWTFGLPGSSFDTPGTQHAATVLESWAKNGYFIKGYSGIGQENAAARFAKGEGLYFLTGPWENGTFEPMGTNVGFFTMPGPTAGTASPTTGSPSLPFHISSKSKHPDIAAAYMDFITSPEAADVVAKNGDLPAAPLAMPSTVDPASSLAAIIAGLEAKSSAGLLTPYLDWATPTMGDTLFGGLQKLMAGQQTPAQFTADVQKDWSKNHPAQ
jgi:raffinose/stachyose/melibiose transport system substrate-binding protein